MPNFTFLKNNKPFASFAESCMEAEKSMAVGYSTVAITTRRALELAVKWVYAHDNTLEVPYQDTLSALIHDYAFKHLIPQGLFEQIRFIHKLGNKAVHTNMEVRREQAVLCLKNLFAFTCWLEYAYGATYEKGRVFDESNLADEKEKQTKETLVKLFNKYKETDKKLSETIQENQKLRELGAEQRRDHEAARKFDIDTLTEWETRKMYIDLELELKGWRFNRDCLVEVPVTGMPSGSGEGYVDYVLYDDDQKPLAVIEAKRTSVDPKVGKTQAKLYADCLEKQYGIRPTIFYTNGFEYYLWDDVEYPERTVSGVYTKKELQWLKHKHHNKKPLENVEINDDITNRGYQKMAVSAVCDTLMNKQRKALLVMATGSGKTRTAISIVDVLMKNGWVQNILFLADRVELVRQAKKNFKNLLPSLTLCNLLDSKDSPESRMVFSTYPTMMNAIDETKNDQGDLLFTSGHFDLIIVDESHRSIYKKYQAIFDYFDAILLGLTATPKNDIDKNTYSIFDLEDNQPTFAYDMEEAVSDGFLVPYYSIETKLKLPEDGIHYDELSDEEKEHFEDTFEEEYDQGVRDIQGSLINQFLFNQDTVDLVLQELMIKGIKVKGGDEIGKTIIFASNQKHADFILDRFDKLFPQFAGKFAERIYTGIKYVRSTFDDFTEKDKLPQIAISVDMLDTGVDIPEIVNLVMFKKIRSKSKFIQMIGRGTRLCPDLFGVGQDKKEFVIFDYCRNFEYFRQDAVKREPRTPKTLSEKLFNIRLSIAKELKRLDFQEPEYQDYRNQLIKQLAGEVASLDDSRFDVKMKLRYVHRYNKKEAYENIKDSEIIEIEDIIAPLVLPYDDDELAKRFDLLMYSIEYASIKSLVANKQIRQVMTTASNLSEVGNIAKVKKKRETIERIQTDEFWNEATLMDYEEVRVALRDLIKFIEQKKQKDYYANFFDEIIESQEVKGNFNTVDLKSYREKVNHYLKAHKDDMVIYKLRNGKKLNQDDINYLEKILWHDLGSVEEYKKAYNDMPLVKMVLGIVGLDKEAVQQRFSKFLSDELLNQSQREFVRMIVDYMVENGGLDKRVLNDHPFNQYGSVTQLFEDRIDVVKNIIKEVDDLG